jgi:hypothetical protein
VGWFYTHETTAFGLKVERHLHKRKKAAHQTPHTHKREIETTVHTEEERRKREKERKKERKWLGKQCCKEKTKAPCFRQQNPT